MGWVCQMPNSYCSRFKQATTTNPLLRLLVITSPSLPFPLLPLSSFPPFSPLSLPPSHFNTCKTSGKCSQNNSNFIGNLAAHLNPFCLATLSAPEIKYLQGSEIFEVAGHSCGTIGANAIYTARHPEGRSSVWFSIPLSAVLTQIRKLVLSPFLSSGTAAPSTLEWCTFNQDDQWSK
jgi:hypothetical protein